MNIGTPVKTKYGTGKIVGILSPPSQNIYSRYIVRLDNPGRYFMAGFHFDSLGRKVKDEAGIVYIFENEMEEIEVKQGEKMRKIIRSYVLEHEPFVGVLVSKVDDRVSPVAFEIFIQLKGVIHREIMRLNDDSQKAIRNGIIRRLEKIKSFEYGDEEHITREMRAANEIDRYQAGELIALIEYGAIQRELFEEEQ